MEKRGGHSHSGRMEWIRFFEFAHSLDCNALWMIVIVKVILILIVQS